MQLPPLTFLDLSVLLAVGAIVLLITTELSSSNLPLANLTLNKKKLRAAALTIGTLFLIAICIRIIEMITFS